MALAINTNVAALNAHRSMKKTDGALSSSLQRLSTGLRINKAADDASGMSIADSLRAQSKGLGQAIRNANDGINIVQTADGALDEAINIVNIIKTKAIQAAQDGQTYESRKIIQNDIDKLLEEVDLLANSTSFNGKKLLSGEFTNKSFQVGSGSGEVAKVSIDSAQANKTGHVTTSNLTIDAPNHKSPGALTLLVHSNLENRDYELETVDLQFNNSAENGIGALGDVINKLSDRLGITAQTVVESSSRGPVKAGDLGTDFKINGVTIGAVTVKANDTDGALAKAINNKSDQTGVLASIDYNGTITLASSDGRAIKVEGDVSDVFTKDAYEMSTFGELRITQGGSNSILIQDKDAGDLTQVKIDDVGSTIDVSNDMLLSQGSTIGSGSVLAAGTRIGFSLNIGTTTGNHGGFTNTSATMDFDSTVSAGSVLASGTVIASGTTVGGLGAIESVILDNDAVIAKGSTLKAGSVIAAGTLLTTDIVNSSGITISAGTTLAVATTIKNDTLLQEDMTINANTVNESFLASGTTIAAGTTISNKSDDTGHDVTITGSGGMIVSEDFTLLEDSKIASGTTLSVGSTLGASFTFDANSGIPSGGTIRETIIAAGSALGSGTTLEVGSTIGGKIELDLSGGPMTLDDDLMIGAGSTLASGTIIAAGTYLTTTINTADGILGPGVTLEQNATITSDLFLTEEMTLEKGSVLKSGAVSQTATTLVGTGGGVTSDIRMDESKVTRLSDIDVTSQESAQIAISVADSALKDYDKIRANLGSVQNQLTSTISNISVTQVNVQAAESAIRDVDFAEESSVFSKLQILAQSGSYAMSQANASSENVMSLLQ